MKKNELLSALRSLQNNKNRTALAVTVGVMAMLLLLLSELLPSGNTQKTAASTVRTAAVSQYQTQLEQQLEELISQLQGGRTHHGHGHPDHRRGDYLCSRYPDRRSATAGEARSFYRMGLRWPRLPICRRSAGLPCCVRAGEMSGLQPALLSCCIRCWICPRTASAWSNASAELLL